MGDAIPQYAVPEYAVPPYATPTIATTPILERIAQWHAAAIESITVADGYSQTLSVTRAGQLALDAGHVRDLAAICSLGDVCSEDAGEEDEGHYCWRQSFDTMVYFLGAGGGDDGEDPRIANVIADIHKLLAWELQNADYSRRNRYCGGLAYGIAPMAWEIGWDVTRQAVYVVVPLLISFEVLNTDPCSQ